MGFAPKNIFDDSQYRQCRQCGLDTASLTLGEWCVSCGYQWALPLKALWRRLRGVMRLEDYEQHGRRSALLPANPVRCSVCGGLVGRNDRWHRLVDITTMASDREQLLVVACIKGTGRTTG